MALARMSFSAREMLAKLANLLGKRGNDRRRAETGNRRTIDLDGTLNRH
jgi:hypothetical protein